MKERIVYLSAFILTLILVASCDSSDVSYELKTNVTPSQSGTISPGDTILTKGAKIQLLAEPSEGFRFVNWLGDVSDSSNPLTIIMDQNINVVGVFEERTYPMNLIIEGEGTVKEEVIPQKISDYDHGTVVRLTATPSEKWRFKEWSGDISGNQNPITIEIDSNKEIRSVFEQTIFTIRGEVFDVYKGDTLHFRPYQSSGQIVYTGLNVGGKSFPVTENGAFEFELERGEHAISFESKYHHNYNTTLSIDSNIEGLKLEAKEKYYDFYNPVIGREKEFTFSNIEYKPQEFRIISSGRMEWKVIRDSIDSESGNTVYIVENKVSGKTIHVQENPELLSDTTIINDISYFQITSHKDTSVTYSEIKYLDEVIGNEILRVELAGKSFSTAIVERCYPLSRVNSGPVKVVVQEPKEQAKFEYSIAPFKGIETYSKSQIIDGVIYDKTLYRENIEYWNHNNMACENY